MQKLYTNCGIDIACIFDLKGDIFSQTHVGGNAISKCVLSRNSL